MKNFSKNQQIILLAIGLAVLTVNLLRPFHRPFSVSSAPSPLPSHQWAIEITGAVCAPGIYTFNNSPTIFQAIQKAGGIAANRCNLLKGQPDSLQSGTCLEAKAFSQTCVKTLISPMNARKMLVLGIPIDVNQAGVEGLALVPGISQGLARRIVEFRQSNSPFKAWQDLRSVKGVGNKNIERIRNYLQYSNTPEKNKARTLK